MSEEIRVHGDLTRYWIANGVPVEEKLIVTYAPHDWRAVEIPDSFQAMYEPELRRLSKEAAVVDGDGNVADPEQVVNRWLVESRSYAESGETIEGDLLLEDAPVDSPMFFNPFKRKPRKGVKSVTAEKFAAAVAARDARGQDDLVRFAEDHTKIGQLRWDAVADKVGKEVTATMIGPRPDLDAFTKALLNPPAVGVPPRS